MTLPKIFNYLATASKVITVKKFLGMIFSKDHQILGDFRKPQTIQVIPTTTGYWLERDRKTLALKRPHALDVEHAEVNLELRGLFLIARPHGVQRCYSGFWRTTYQLPYLAVGPACNSTDWLVWCSGRVACLLQRTQLLCGWIWGLPHKRKAISNIVNLIKSLWL